MKIKKFLASLLAVTCLACLFVACTEDADSSKRHPQDGPTSSSTDRYDNDYNGEEWTNNY